jgi:hypothetical protein
LGLHRTGAVSGHDSVVPITTPEIKEPYPQSGAAGYTTTRQTAQKNS